MIYQYYFLKQFSNSQTLVKKFGHQYPSSPHPIDTKATRCYMCVFCPVNDSVKQVGGGNFSQEKDREGGLYNILDM